MSTSGTIYKKISEYNEKKFLKDILEIADKMNLCKGEYIYIEYKGGKNCDKIKSDITNCDKIEISREKLKYIDISVYDKKKIINIGGENGDDYAYETANIHVCRFEVAERDNLFGILEEDELPNWLLKEKYEKMCGIAYIDSMSSCGKMSFDLIYEYLKLNPEDVFWTEGDWVFTLEDMEKISKMPHDESWYYEKPE